MVGLSLDDAVESFRLPKPTLLRISGDSAAAILAGGQRELKRRQVRMLVEVRKDAVEDVEQLATKLGLKLVGRHGDSEEAAVWFRGVQAVVTEMAPSPGAPVRPPA